MPTQSKGSKSSRRSSGHSRTPRASTSGGRSSSRRGSSSHSNGQRSGNGSTGARERDEDME